MSPDRRWDDETRNRLTDIARGYRTFTHRTYLILALLVVLQFATGLLSLYLLVFNVPDQAKHFAVEINEQRAKNILDGCNDSNKRHDATVRRLRTIAKDNHVPLSRLQPTITLIDALAPRHDDCKQLVATQVQGPGSTTQP